MKTHDHVAVLSSTRQADQIRRGDMPLLRSSYRGVPLC